MPLAVKPESRRESVIFDKMTPVRLTKFKSGRLADIGLIRNLEDFKRRNRLHARREPLAAAEAL